jgi:NTP pyrophosphatase (non-canonical NTP hydrolase)
MQGEETELPESIEVRHLKAIQSCHFVWLHAPEGYVGPTAALEVGFARASGIPVFCKNSVNDKILQSFVHIVPSATEALARLTDEFLVPPPGIQSFQHYYKRVAVQRGYDKEDAQNCLLLMVEEVGELARAIRKRENLVRHGTADVTNEALELADVFLYVIHMANVLGLDLSKVVREKEIINFERFVASKRNEP